MEELDLATCVIGPANLHLVNVDQLLVVTLLAVQRLQDLCDRKLVR
jgi:hypothetical protein